MILPIITALVLLSGIVERSYGSEFLVDVSGGGPYSILVNNVTWLSSGDTEFRHDGRTYSTSDGSLKLLNTSTDSNTDIFGLWQSINFTYQAGSLFVMTAIKMYTLKPYDLPLVIFTQKYLGNAISTSARDSNLVISKFPSFKMKAPIIELGYMAYNDGMAGYERLRYGRFEQPALLPTGMAAGPIVLFDLNNNAMVISPLNQFMAASSSLDLTKQINWGIMGMVDSVPQDYTIGFIVYFSDKGINQAMRDWGNHLKTLYGKNSELKDNDPTIKYMGYWTDNGAYYYYNTEPGKIYEQTVLDADSYFNQIQIPFKYLQFDSWWYPKGHKGGVTTWTPPHGIFPDGFKYIYEKTKLPIGCHNKYWDSNTTYAVANGGQYNFIIDEHSGYAVPDDPAFWPYLFKTTQGWGKFILYEQDWLSAETENNAVLLKDLFLGRRWLMEMGSAAEEFGITVQYCGSYPRHILQALEIPAVTQARVSHDYQPGYHQWDIGVTAMFADAVQIAPFKDTFWTTNVQPGSPYKSLNESAPALNHLVATLSTGPVGPGDGIGFINESLLMRCCDSTGLILKPSKPITAINDQIKRSTFQTYPGPDGEVYTTYSNHSNFIFGTVLAADLKNEYSLTPSSGWTGIDLRTPMYVYHNSYSYIVPVPFSESDPLKLGPECTTTDFCLYYMSPLIGLQDDVEHVVLLGEPDKWVPLSNQRFSQINASVDDLTLTLRVQAKETVLFNFWVKGETAVRTIWCDNSQNSEPAENTFISIAHELCQLGF